MTMLWDSEWVLLFWTSVKVFEQPVAQGRKRMEVDMDDMEEEVPL